MSSRIARSLFTSIALVAVAGVAMTAGSLSHTRTLDAAPSAPSHDAWLNGLTAKHRQLFDSPDPAGGVPLVHILNYYETYNKAYGVADKDVNAIGTFYGMTTFYGVNDAMWAKYRIGEFLKTNDAVTGKPATANPWRVAPVAIGLTLPQASIESLQKRGATFIICNNALTIFSGLLANARGLKADEVLADLKANILPGVTLVPGMVVAIEKAQERGISYHRQ
jgi:intracellular sulfur oxidation DsrE/DsrF family protein